jgi:hypothetical protein
VDTGFMTITSLDMVEFEKFESHRTGTIVFIFKIDRVRADLLARLINSQKRYRSQRKRSFTLISPLIRQTTEILLANGRLIESLLAYSEHDGQLQIYIGFERSRLRLEGKPVSVERFTLC